MARLKFAELTSGVGALVLGIGLGALFADWFATVAGFMTLGGIVAHAFGMWDKHRLEAESHAEGEPWVIAVYWLCWMLLAGLVLFVLVVR